MMKKLTHKGHCFSNLKWYSPFLLIGVLMISFTGMYAQHVEVQGKLKVMDLDTLNNENLMVVKKPDGTLAGRQISSLSLPMEDTTRSLQSDLLLTMALCNCESLPPAIIQSLLENGYSIQDLLAFEISPLYLFNTGIPVDSLFGKTYKGGLIFFLDTLFYDIYPFEGLVAAPHDQSGASSEWGCSGISITGADMDAIGSGSQNTSDIEAECLTFGIAADICANLVLNGYHDWFLPSNNETLVMWEILADFDGNGTNSGLGDPGNRGNFATDSYWSSTEVDSDTAKSRYFGNGLQDDDLKNQNLRVRAIRAF